MGDYEEKWGKPQLNFEGKPIAIIENEVLGGLGFKTIGSDNEWNHDAPSSLSFSCEIKILNMDGFIHRTFKCEARCEASLLLMWIRNRMVGSRLPRKKKKWYKTQIAKKMSPGYPSEKHILKYIKPNKR